MDLRVDSTTDGQVLTLVGRGEIDYATLDILETELDKATASDAESVVVDMRDVTYIDSAGLGVLVKAHRRMAAEKRDFVLQGRTRGRGPPPPDPQPRPAGSARA